MIGGSATTHGGVKCLSIAGHGFAAVIEDSDFDPARASKTAASNLCASSRVTTSLDGLNSSTTARSGSVTNAR